MNRYKIWQAGKSPQMSHAGLIIADSVRVDYYRMDTSTAFIRDGRIVSMIWSCELSWMQVDS